MVKNNCIAARYVKSKDNLAADGKSRKNTDNLDRSISNNVYSKLIEGTLMQI